MSNTFDWLRFTRLFRNDLLQQWRRIWIATLALAGMGLVVYLTNVDPRGVVQPAIYAGLFPIALIAGGVLFTSTIFADLHHPLRRFHYLTLPSSNLERFLSRYLLSAPLYYLYVLVVYALFDWLAAMISQAFMHTRAAPFAPFEPRLLEMTLQFFGLHALMFLGAIYFRSHALIKSALSAVLIWFGLALVLMVAVRLFFWSYFTSVMMPIESAATTVRLLPVPLVVRVAAALLFYLWLLFIAYQCLREHEVQREL